jgi:hypothetical protein
MTWYEFKKEMEKQGVTDTMGIDYMDFNFFDANHVGLQVDFDHNMNEFSVH